MFLTVRMQNNSGEMFLGIFSVAICVARPCKSNTVFHTVLKNQKLLMMLKVDCFRELLHKIYLRIAGSFRKRKPHFPKNWVQNAVETVAAFFTLAIYCLENLRYKATFPAWRGITSEAVTGAISCGHDWHCVTAADWLTVHFILSTDHKLKMAWTRGPFGWGHYCTRAGRVYTIGGVAVEPVFWVRTRWVSGPQGNGISTVYDRESMA